MFMIYDPCDNCSPDSAHHERVFTDSYTGMSLCIDCLYPAIGHITMSPSEDGDNLRKVVVEYSGDRTSA